MIRGMHAMFYSSQAEALRTFLKDKLGLAGTDVGGGWLIFDAPEADLGVHPTEDSEVVSGTADISFYCDDIAQTVSELRMRGVEGAQLSARRARACKRIVERSQDTEQHGGEHQDPHAADRQCAKDTGSTAGGRGRQDWGCIQFD